MKDRGKSSRELPELSVESEKISLMKGLGTDGLKVTYIINNTGDTL